MGTIPTTSAESRVTVAKTLLHQQRPCKFQPTIHGEVCSEISGLLLNYFQSLFLLASWWKRILITVFRDLYFVHCIPTSLFLHLLSSL